jgi:hypothetical protein
MLCGEGCGLQVVDHLNEADNVYLVCKHTRPFGLLASNGVSLEDLWFRPGLFNRLFPAVDIDGSRPGKRGRDLADVIDDIEMQGQRDRWAQAA